MAANLPEAVHLVLPAELAAKINVVGLLRLPWGNTVVHGNKDSFLILHFLYPKLLKVLKYRWAIRVVDHQPIHFDIYNITGIHVI